MELELCIGDRMTIAGRVHGDASDHTRPRILCCHGQADNAASFDSLAPLLVDAGFVVFAMDLSGHGRSSWRSTLYDPALFCLELIQTLDCLEWRSAVTLMGHSFGQAVVSMVAGAFPERVSAVVLLEGLGLWNDFPFLLCRWQMQARWDLGKCLRSDRFETRGGSAV
jgi:pimeloyl-ACP methyl ester carboxylesterase